MIKKLSSKELEKQKIVIYKTDSGKASVDIKLLDETLWLSINQIADLFERDKSVVAKHLRKIFKEGELSKNSVVAKFATTASDGKTYNVGHYNLDAIISVGYRINSKRGTEFRKWASQILKEHLIQGYSLNQQRLDKKSIGELQQTIDLLSKTMINQELTNEIGIEILQIISNYSKTWDTLLRFDEDKLESKNLTVTNTMLDYKEVSAVIKKLKDELYSKCDANNLFGQERAEGLRAILGNIEQSFDGKFLYDSIQERAASLLYFVIKDHPFSDGNKRIACLAFLMYLEKAGYNIRLISNNALIALALLVAESKPQQKENMIQLIMYLLQE